MSEFTDEELMARFVKALDEEPFQELASRYVDRAHAVASAVLHNRTEAEDAVQEAFLRVIRSRRRYAPDRAFSPWFYTILRNVCRDVQRKRKRREQFLREQALTVGHCPLPETACWDLVEELPLPQQRVLQLKIGQGLTFGETAAALGCTVEAAKKRAQRALKRLREKVAEPTSTPRP